MKKIENILKDIEDSILLNGFSVKEYKEPNLLFCDITIQKSNKTTLAIKVLSVFHSRVIIRLEVTDEVKGNSEIGIYPIEFLFDELLPYWVSVREFDKKEKKRKKQYEKYCKYIEGYCQLHEEVQQKKYHFDLAKEKMKVLKLEKSIF